MPVLLPLGVKEGVERGLESTPKHFTVTPLHYRNILTCPQSLTTPLPPIDGNTSGSLFSILVCVTFYQLLSQFLR